jgi:DNA modification methylase
MGRHRLVCGDAQSPEPYLGLMQGQKADLVFTDPPYNLPIEGHVSGLGRHQHQGFCMGIGEMSPEAFTQFLQASLGAMANVCKDGAIAFVCMDWRHIGELISAGGCVFSELKNLCVWNKTNAGMGSFYRSKHELVLVYKVGTADHTNTFGLGRSGRYRTNVWDYAGVTSFSGGRQDALAMHPTVKPTAMVADAIKDCSKRGDIVLDGFGGSGTTLIAAQACGRSARIIELDPQYCDTIVRRYQAYTGKAAVLEANGQTFDSLEDQDLEDIPNVQV